MVKVFDGIGYLVRGAHLMTQPGLRQFAAIPLIANIIVFFLTASFLYVTLSDWYISVAGELADGWHFITWLVGPLMLLVGTMLSGYVSVLIVLILTSPFHGLLAERAEEIITGETLQIDSSSLAIALSVPRALLREIQKLAHYLPIAIAVIIVSIIPGINALSPLLWILLGAWMMSLQFVDYPMDNHRLPFREVRAACAAKRTTSLSFGASVAFVSGIPILNLFLIPAAVTGATLFWCEHLRQHRHE
ncbi:MAG: sulfate transporter CysZ [Luminiphilus sp.]|nr:sulfate transporter CysZ [Luminiphilus sp.]